MITFRNIEIRLGTKVLLQQASLLISPGEKASLIGRNGAGKSTILALLCGQIREDAGDVEIPAKWGLSRVDQHMPETVESATEFVLQGDVRLMQARKALENALARDDGMEMAQAYSDLADAGDHDAAARAKALIQGLGFKPIEVDNPVNSFSGGWRMRLQLARALMCPSDLLLLDEPTNHLDMDALIWLETWLRKYEGTLLVISHDREFLDAVTGVTVHLEHTQLHRYNGNYSAFERLRAEKLEQQTAAHAKQQEKMAHLQQYIDRFRYKATKARQAQSRIKALERMEKTSAVIADAEFTFVFKEPLNLPNPMIAVDDVDFGYPEIPGTHTGTRTILSNVRKTVFAGQRIGILGANGQGKSTFVKTIARNLKSLSGSITEGKGLAIGYFAQQELDVLKVDETPLTHMLNLAKDIAGQSGRSAREQELRNFLGTFNISGDMVIQAVSTLSGGEKARLVLCMIVWQRPNLLLLDEPTNHLDLATREALALALNQFDGSVMLVSHDRALLRSVCDEFWLVGNGEVSPFEGDLEDYQRYLLDEGKRSHDVVRSRQVDASTESSFKRKDARGRPQSDKHRKAIYRELQTIEQLLPELRDQKSRHEQRLLTNPICPDMQNIALLLKQLEAEIEASEDCWLQLQYEVDGLGK
ncbi:ABC-F family ATP-binding cassette domain-containing protein [Pseudomonas sp. TH10]|uniref:ABC-F family ATP-binding cassette domain-containing protein n=1 Tax=Pseudomonas sp. TH10 TaxID=2796376 RepID=UPI0019138C20|nr:ATP-binding cassette domain-containing protein [Pseudomonas sp. TH10]MBK5516719.1 ATP-binding cassette domain-containing protein [Pseudomonas sp. TH10]